MQLHLPIPPEWRHSERDGRRFIMPHDSDDLVIVLEPMEPLPPLHEGAWLQRRVHRDVPAGARLIVRKTVPQTTRLGWPALVLDIQLVEENTSPAAQSTGAMPLPATRFIEQRVTTFYRFLEYCALAEVRARDLALLVEYTERLRALFIEGRPDWSGTDVSLMRLLSGLDR